MRDNLSNWKGDKEGDKHRNTHTHTWIQSSWRSVRTRQSSAHTFHLYHVHISLVSMVTSSRHGNGEQAVEEKLNSHDCPQFILEPCTHTHTPRISHCKVFGTRSQLSVCVNFLKWHVVMIVGNAKTSQALQVNDMHTRTHTNRPSHARDKHEEAESYLHTVVGFNCTSRCHEVTRSIWRVLGWPTR